MTDLRAEFDRDVSEDMNRIAGHARDSLTRGVLFGAEIAAGEIRREIASTFQQWTGKMGRSFRATLLERDGNKIAAGALSDLVYAEKQWRGGIIKPKRAKALAIPFSDRAKTISRRGSGPRMFPTPLELIWPKSRRTGLLVERTRNKSILHYILAKKVYIKPKPYLERAMTRAEPQILEALGDTVQTSINDSERE